MLTARTVLLLVVLLTLSPFSNAGKAPHGSLLLAGTQGCPIGVVRKETPVWSRGGAAGRRINPWPGQSSTSWGAGKDGDCS